ncbi:hypothetical protein GYH30_055631 [Glycine max]|uniref:Uncharacterized protein n=1 Tax=Glycine max TaxID=3847 RepID=A0A0R0EBP2_SOYBN|nr:hypothetical protein GYH30_055631 [Glycine max]
MCKNYITIHRLGKHAMILYLREAFGRPSWEGEWRVLGFWGCTKRRPCKLLLRCRFGYVLLLSFSTRYLCSVLLCEPEE